MTALLLVIMVVAAIAALAVMGYRMGPAPGQRAITDRDRRLQAEQAELTARRLRTNPNLRRDHDDAIVSLASAAVRLARDSRMEDPLLSETEALADALVEIDRLEQQATAVNIGPLIPAVVALLGSVGVLESVPPTDPRLAALSRADVTSSPGILVRIIGVANLYSWPHSDRTA